MSKQILQQVIDDPKLNPCQLEKIEGMACSFFCAMMHDCPVYYIDANDNPRIRKITALDLEPIEARHER